MILMIQQQLSLKQRIELLIGVMHKVYNQQGQNNLFSPKQQVQSIYFCLSNYKFYMQLANTKKNDHSLGPDYFTGWKLNTTTFHFRQIPLYFTNPNVDNISKTLTSFGSQQPYRVVYMGPRFTSNYKAFKAYSQSQSFQDSACKFQTQMFGQFFLKYDFKFQHEKQKVFPIRPLQYRLFTGMNPTIKKDDLRFDANFQCGNLDLAISINSFEYDLIMRVDSNTRGHTTWFYFMVTNFTDKQKVKFNIINFQKDGLMYKEGMKPYCYRSSKKKWEQEGGHIQYRSKKFRYTSENQSNSILMNCLSFMYQFSKDDEYVCFSYCVPYTYSYLLHRISSLQKENPHFVRVERNLFSTGGLQIPVLTITNSREDKDKPYCLAVGRLHPGETQGSWVLDGFLKFLCSPKGYYLRQKYVFKIIPMINVDGVVLGNFRTGISGRDLNRVFDQPSNFPQIQYVRQIAQKYNPQIFLDFHGHSAKKNVFMYGPNYGVDSKFYLTSRIFPKFISKLTSIFRYYSCVFKVSKNKINTGRSIMMKVHNVPFSFTIESSSYGYGPKSDETLFNKIQYQEVGQKIAEGLQKFVKILLILPKRLQKNDQSGEKQKKLQISDTKLSPRPSKKDRKSQAGSQKQITSNLFDFKEIEQMLFPEERQLLSEIINDEKQIQGKIEENEQQDSDFEDGDDYSEKQLKRMFQKVNQDEASLEKNTKNKKKKKKKRDGHGNKKIKQSLDEQQASPQKLSQSPESNTNLIKEFVKIKSQQYKKSKIKSRQKQLNNNHKNTEQKLPQIGQQILIFSKNEELQDVSETRNKVYYNNWRKDFSPFVSLQKKYVKPSSSLNHVNLDYTLDKLKEQDCQQKLRKQRSRQKKVKSRFHRDKEREENSYKKIQRNYSLKNSVDYVGSKQILFPLISKNKSVQFYGAPGASTIEQILTNHQKIQKNATRKNIKIVYV